MKEGHSSVEEARYRAMQAVEYYQQAVLASDKTGGAIQPDSAYKSLGAVFGQETAAPDTRGDLINYGGVKSSRSVQNMAERSYSVSEVNRSSVGGPGLVRTPHRAAGYGGAGQPTRGPHRFGNPDMRASYSERLTARQRPAPVPRSGPSDTAVYKSNSSLDLDHEADILQESSVTTGPSRREYGSHGSLNMMGREVLNGFPGEGPVAVSTLTRTGHYNSGLNRSEESNAGSGISNNTNDDLDSGAGSPKQKKKAMGFWGNKDKNARKSQKSLFKKRTKDGSESVVKTSVDLASCDNLDNKAEDKHRRRFFSHYDTASVCASLSITAQLRTLQRRNTTTGASAASAALRGGGDSLDNHCETDHGDGVNNQLVLSCPYFRNEIGGEQETGISLTRETGKFWGLADEGLEKQRQPAHTPRQARGFSLLEQKSTHWKSGICPYNSHTGPLVIERLDLGSTYFKNFFYGKDHQNWFGIDENLGPVAVTIRRERVPATGEENRLMGPHLSNTSDHFMYRLIVRTSDLLPLRGTVLEDSIPALKSEKIKTIPTKEVLEFCFPELQLTSLHLGIQSGPCEEQLVRLDEQCNEKTYKVGVMYCRAGQQTEEEMYNNEEGGPAFNEFLDLIGQRVRLKGFNKYKAGLCNKNDSTGLYSVYSEFEGNEIMFHVSTLLPYTPNNRQQLPRKRHIGNDIVTVVFQEPGALPFIPNIRSQFQHVFIIVRAHNPCSDNTQYSLAVTRSKNVPMFGPPIPASALFSKNSSFTKFILTKIINAENAAHRSDKFVSMATRTRQEYLKDLASNYSTQTTIDSGSKFALFAPKKKMAVRPRFSPDASLRGALSWAVMVEDCSTNTQIESFIAISSDTLVIIQDNPHRDILFICPCKSVLGWSTTNNSIRIFYHQGECVIVHIKDWEAQDLDEISARLKSVSPGAASQEFSLRRNQLGQLGFHVQHDGLITEVENFGYAWQTGLRQGSRLVEICKHPVCTLTHEQMVDLLKTSMTVTVTVIPPHPDGSPRQGCNLNNCSYTFGGFDGDYENVSGEGEKTCIKPGVVQVPSNGKMRYERSLSPPRSSSSSGYGTGSSSKSFMEPGGQARYPGPGEGTLTSCSSGHSSDERWYDFMDQPASTDNSPPPLPTRIGSKPSAFQKVTDGPGTEELAGPAKKYSLGQARLYNGYESGSSSDTVKSSSTVQVSQEVSREARSTYLTDYELNNNRSSVESESPDNFLQHDRLSALKTSPQLELEGGAGRSEDELSVASHSPARPRQGGRRTNTGTTTPSTPSSSASASSRGQSPRTTAQTLDGVAKKKVGRSARNSANLTQSTLQEDLMKLISPDFEQEPGAKHETATVQSVQHDSPLSKLPKKTLSELSLMKSRSRENIARLEDRSEVSPEVTFHMARPATVISNNSGTVSPNTSNLSDKSQARVSGPATNIEVKNGAEPGQMNMEWTSLVDTATKAISEVSTDDPPPADTETEPPVVVTEVPSQQVQTLLDRMAALENQLEEERQEKSELESEIVHLKEENVRLKEESQTAAQQLRRFTEWFFQTIDKS